MKDDIFCTVEIFEPSAKILLQDIARELGVQNYY